MTEKLLELCREGGLQVGFETIATLHQCSLFEGEEETDEAGIPSASLHWEVLQYGIPVVIANENGVALCLADIESGEKMCEFRISTSSQYVAVDGHFHVLAVSCGCFGINFADSSAGVSLLTLLKRIVPCIDEVAEEDLEPASKQPRVEAGETDEAIEEVDGLFRRKSDNKEKSELVISGPRDFQHLSHVGEDTAISDLTKAMSWTDTLKRKERIIGKVFPSNVPMYNCKEVDTVSTTSFMMEFTVSPAPPATLPPPPAPPPPMVAPPAAKVVLKKKGSISETSGSCDLRSSLAEELKRGVVLRPVGSGRYGSSDSSSLGSNTSFDSLQEELKKGVILKSAKTNGTMRLPLPPRRNKSETLLFEINTFRRKKLRHISSSNSVDFSSNEKSFESIMKRSLDTMFKKLSILEIATVGTVSSNGEDTFDGLLSI